MRVVVFPRGSEGYTNCLDRPVMAETIPELPASGLVLWRLSHQPKQQIECSVTLNYRGALALTVRNVPSCKVLVAEAHPDAGSLVRHSDDLKMTFVAAGWWVTELQEEDEPVR